MIDALNKPKRWRYVRLFVLACGAVVVMWIVLPLWFPDDNYAGANSLFSGLAFAVLIVAIILQMEELQLQRIELEQTRQELKGQKEQLEGQKRQMEIQNFENRFFQMVKAWDSVLQSVALPGIPAGRETFRNFVDRLKPSYGHEYSKNPTARPESIINDCIVELYRGRTGDVANYMRTLYTIIKMIDRAQIENEDKKFYSNIVRAQLSQSELVVIFYNCLSKYGREKSKPLVEKYSLLKHLDDSGLIKPEHRQLYDPNAFN